MNIEGIDMSITIEDIREECENYRTTIKVLQAFTSLTWDVKTNNPMPGSHFTIGRMMDTSSINKIQPNNYVTPDAVIQFSDTLGYIVEVKNSLPKLVNDNWSECVEQLLKYDDDLVGWWTEGETIQTSCVVLLLDATRSNVFKRYLETLIQEGKASFRKPLSIVQFSKTPTVKEFWLLQKHWGYIEDKEMSSRLEDGVAIPLIQVLGNPIYGEKKFYDPPPPHVEYMMVELWENLFNDKKQHTEYDSSLHAWPIPVNVEDLTIELQLAYGSQGKEHRMVAFPLNAWVRDALEAFVWLKLAQKENNDNYLILFRLIIKKELFSYFFEWRRLSTKGKRKDQSKQMPLFTENKV